MRPPEWVLKRLEEIHPLCRLGYHGGEEFAILELWRVREDTIIGVPYVQGHVFGSDYDRLFYVPRQIASLDVQAVFNGDVIDHVRVMAKPFKERQLARLRAEGERYESAVTELAEEMGSELYWSSKRTGAERPEPVPQKFLTQEEKDILSGEHSAAHSLKDAFMPTGAGTPIK